MAKVKKDDMFCCADCGLEVVVNKACGCINTELLCCGGPMVREKPSSRAPGKTALGKASAKAALKSKAVKQSFK